MSVRMCLKLVYGGGAQIDEEIRYVGDSLEEIAHSIDKDNNELLEFMLTRDTKGQEAFCFGGFMFAKAGLIIARMWEPDY